MGRKSIAEGSMPGISQWYLDLSPRGVLGHRELEIPPGKVGVAVGERRHFSPQYHTAPPLCYGRLGVRMLTIGVWFPTVATVYGFF
jgi:hypothetical protein